MQIQTEGVRGKSGGKKAAGFSLIELLIVVAIILIIAAIAIPNLIKSKMAANEASAVGSVRTINTGEVNYAASCPAVGFSATLAELNSGRGLRRRQGHHRSGVVGRQEERLRVRVCDRAGWRQPERYVFHDGCAGHDWYDRSAGFLFGPDGRDPLYAHWCSTDERQQLVVVRGSIDTRGGTDAP